MSVSKPCVICEQPIVRSAPSELARVSAHKRCQGFLVTLRAAARREDRLMERWAELRPDERVRLATAYRLGARHTVERLRMRYRARRVAQTRHSERTTTT